MTMVMFESCLMWLNADACQEPFCRECDRSEETDENYAPLKEYSFERSSVAHRIDDSDEEHIVTYLCIYTVGDCKRCTQMELSIDIFVRSTTVYTENCIG